MIQFLRRKARPLQASAPTKGLDARSIGLVLTIAASCVFFLASMGTSQDPKDVADGIERKAIVHFAMLVFREEGQTEKRRIPAADLDRIQLIRPMGGDDYWLELFYRGGDYGMQKIDLLVFLRRDGAAQQMKLPVNLVRADRMAFPFVN